MSLPAAALVAAGEIVLEDQFTVGDALVLRIARLRQDVGDLVGQHVASGVAHDDALQQGAGQHPVDLGPGYGDGLGRARRIGLVADCDGQQLGGVDLASNGDDAGQQKFHQ